MWCNWCRCILISSVESVWQQVVKLSQSKDGTVSFHLTPGRTRCWKWGKGREFSEEKSALNRYSHTGPGGSIAHGWHVVGIWSSWKKLTVSIDAVSIFPDSFYFFFFCWLTQNTILSSYFNIKSQTAAIFSLARVARGRKTAPLAGVTVRAGQGQK